MATGTLDGLLKRQKSDLKDLQRYYKSQQRIIDNLLKDGNDAIHDLNIEYAELAAKKRALLVEVRALEDKRDILRKEYYNDISEIKAKMERNTL